MNLDRRPDRWAHMRREAAQAGFELERIASVDAQKPDVAAAAAEVPPMANGHRMSAGAFGCFNSHRAAWTAIVESGEPHGMVLEDDMILAPGFGALVNGTAWIPADADVVKLETWGTRAHVAKAGSAVGGRHLGRLLSSHIGGGCYILSAATAKRLLAMTARFSDPVDELLFNETLAFFPTAHIYQMVPAPAVQGKRSDSGMAEPEWSEGSIMARFADGGPTEPGREGKLERLLRRTREELRKLRLGSRYDVIRFG
ncbi:glycosyltransferase family 25 protein [Sandaracinobacter neustonicus]|nr:glycosyltransferase family 25 protein [Sandaracinobacter neustonicus]